jgi:hypothetical protein
LIPWEAKIKRGKDRGPIRLKKGIKASGVEGLTFEDPENGHSRSMKDTISGDSSLRILRTGWGKPTAGRKEGRYGFLIKADRPT